MPHAGGIYTSATEIIRLEVVGLALVVLVALAFYWIIGWLGPNDVSDGR